MAPAMNVRMWLHPATQRNRPASPRTACFVGPNEGEMACGEFGPGRMAEPAEIVEAIAAAFGPKPGPLAGRHVVVTSGPTHEPIDPVRYIANRSSGRQGSAIAEALARRGARRDLRHRPGGGAAARGARGCRGRDRRGDARGGRGGAAGRRRGLRRGGGRLAGGLRLLGEDQEGRGRPAGARGRREPDILATIAGSRTAAGRGSSSASPRRPTT
jgi:hypothetical protein